MKILVCVKAIPNSDYGITLDDSRKRIVPICGNGYRMNIWDACALETALRLKDKGFADKTDVITCGVRDVEPVIRRSLGMGADRGIHIVFENEENPDTMTVAKHISHIAGTGNYDLILCGAMGEYGMEAAVGPMIAALLDLPFAASAVELDVLSGINSIIAASELEAGIRQIIRMKLPCLVTIQTSADIPRYPKLSAMLKANKSQIEKVFCKETSYPAKQMISGFRIPETVRKTRFLAGTASEKAGEMISVMREKGFIV